MAVLPLLLAMQMAAGPPCPSFVAAPKELAAWNTGHQFVTAALTPAALAQARVPLGRAADVVLAPAGTLRFAADPAKKPPQDSRGGLVAVDVPRAGTYRVALSTGAWIDVVQGRAAVASTAHGHGPQCSGVAKTVDFPLKAGRTVLQVSGTGEQRVTVLVVPIG